VRARRPFGGRPRAQVRHGRDRGSASRPDRAEQRRPAGRRVGAHQAARHWGVDHRAEARSPVAGGPRARRGRDDGAQRGRGPRDAGHGQERPCRHRRHGLWVAGHLRTLLEASGAAAELTAAAVPLLPRAREAAERGAIPGGTTRNVEGVADAVTFAGGVDATTRLLLADAQTSGGLLIAVAPEPADALVAALGREGTLAAAVIGRVVAGGAGRIAVR